MLATFGPKYWVIFVLVICKVQGRLVAAGLDQVDNFVSQILYLCVYGMV